MLTHDDAIREWPCPYRQGYHLAGGINIGLSKSGIDAKIETETPSQNITNTLCIGVKCPMWRWFDPPLRCVSPIVPATHEPFFVDADRWITAEHGWSIPGYFTHRDIKLRRGYCGLAGRPKWDEDWDGERFLTEYKISTNQRITFYKFFDRIVHFRFYWMKHTRKLDKDAKIKLAKIINDFKKYPEFETIIELLKEVIRHRFFSKKNFEWLLRRCSEVVTGVYAEYYKDEKYYRLETLKSRWEEQGFGYLFDSNAPEEDEE